MTIPAIIRLEMKKTFFAKRGLWIYLLALAPVALFFVHSMVELRMHGVRQEMARKSLRPLTERDFASISGGMSRADVIAQLGNPPVTSSRTRRVRTGRRAFESISIETFRYSDGNNELTIRLENGVVAGVGRVSGIGLGQDTYVFAGVFQFFFIRLAIFFGCLGIFMNLFRGEMLDRTLHFYLLTPIRREVLLLGKYLAGLLAAVVIFSTSALLQIASLLYQFDSDTITHYLDQNGLSQIASYLGVTVLACIGYGSVFLAAGPLFRNPIVAAAIVLIWESINPILPALLKKFSVIYYLKSLCPVEVTLDPGMPALFALLASNPEPISRYIAIFGVLALSVVVLAASARRVRTLEINYTTD